MARASLLYLFSKLSTNADNRSPKLEVALDNVVTLEAREFATPLVSVDVDLKSAETISLNDNRISHCSISNSNELKNLYVQNNNLEYGYLKVNSWTYNSHEWSNKTNFDSKTRITAYGNRLAYMFTDQGSNNRTYSFMVKYADTIPSNRVVIDVRMRAWHKGVGCSTSGYGFGISSASQYIYKSENIWYKNEYTDEKKLVRSDLTSLNQTFYYRLDAGDNNGTKVTDWGGYGTNDFSHDWNDYQSRTAIKALIYPFGI